MIKTLRLTFLACLALCLGACVEPDGEESEAAVPIKLLPVSFAEWQQVLDAQSGHILVIDLWASWCAPCIERFPHMVELHHKYHDRGVRFISLNFDEAGDTESLQWAEAFLQRVMAVFPNYHLDENMMEAFERLDLLALPVVLVHDPEGNVAYRLTGDNPNKQFTEKDVEQAVLALLALNSSIQ
jgi:thiol-disulfide isomerase/thioredoxin